MIKLGFTDTFSTAINFFSDILEFERNDSNPEYLIFGDPNFGQNHTKYTCTKIFYTGENIRPTYYLHDYALTFDHVNSPIHYRLPLYVLEMHSLAKEKGEYPWTDDFLYLTHRQIDVEKEWDTKKDISYVQANPNVPFRNHFVQELMKIRRVDSGGPHLNNMGEVVPRPGGHLDKIRFLAQRRFNIAFENGSYPGYVTEKLLNAYYANTIPIYWGSSTVHRDFNKKSMICVNDYKDIKEVFEVINEMDNNKNLYCEMLSQPPFENNIPNEWTNLQSITDWFKMFVFKGE